MDGFSQDVLLPKGHGSANSSAARIRTAALFDEQVTHFARPDAATVSAVTTTDPDAAILAYILSFPFDILQLMLSFTLC
jgi:hypothetical protein